MIAGLTPIKLHLQKLVGRSQLCALSLPPNHLIQILMELPFSTPKCWYPALLDTLNGCQRALIKGHLVDSDNRSNGNFLLFILNFLWVSESLTNFQIVFILIYVIKKKITKSTSNSLIIWLLSHLSPHPQLLS